MSIPNTPEPDLSDGEIPAPQAKPKPGFVWISHQSFNGYFLAGVVAAAGVGVLGYLVDGHPRWLGTPAVMVFLWGWLRAAFYLTDPARGGYSPRISHVPGMVPLLVLGGAWVLLGLVVFVIAARLGYVATRRELETTATTLNALGLAAVWLAGLLAIAAWVDRRYKRSSRKLIQNGGQCPPYKR